MASLPIRFLTPFPHRSYRRLRNSHNSSYPITKFCFFLRYPLFSKRAQYILAVRLRRIPSKNNIVAQKRCWEDPRGYVPLVAGRFLASEKGRQRVARKQASVGRGKAERFPLQGGSGRLNLLWSLHPFQCIFYYSIEISLSS